MPAIVAVAAVVIFVGTVFPYLTSRSGLPVGWAPLSLGIALFALLVGWCTFSLSSGPNGRWLSVWVAVVVSSIAYFMLFLFLVLNVVGS
jgi:hypothetical protein